MIEYLKFKPFSTKAPPWWGPILLLPIAIIAALVIDIVILHIQMDLWEFQK